MPEDKEFWGLKVRSVGLNLAVPMIETHTFYWHKNS
jgi:hypothetical protein